MDFGIFLGAFLGFSAGLVLQWLNTFWQRRERRHLYGNLLAVELLKNLHDMNSMLAAMDRTAETGYTIAETSIGRPRLEIMRSIATTADVLLSFSREDQFNLAQMAGHVERLLTEYQDWPDAIGGQRGTLRMRGPDGSEHFAREIATSQLQSTTMFVMEQHIGRLVVTLNDLSGRHLAKSLRPIRTALEPTRRNWKKSKRVNLAARSPEADELPEEMSPEVLVVWTHGRSQYPVTVIELGPLYEAATE